MSRIDEWEEWEIARLARQSSEERTREERYFDEMVRGNDQREKMERLEDAGGDTAGDGDETTVPMAVGAGGSGAADTGGDRISAGEVGLTWEN